MAYIKTILAHDLVKSIGFNAVQQASDVTDFEANFKSLCTLVQSIDQGRTDTQYEYSVFKTLVTWDKVRLIKSTKAYWLFYQYPRILSVGDNIQTGIIDVNGEKFMAVRFPKVFSSIPHINLTNLTGTVSNAWPAFITKKGFTLNLTTSFRGKIKWQAVEE